MTNITLFKPQAELSTEKNLTAFISMAKNQIKLWDKYGLDWDAKRWSTHHNNIRFHNFDSRQLRHKKDLPTELTMSSPFIDFAKAYIRYTQQINITKTFSRDYLALTLLEKALIKLDGCSDVTKAAPRHFDKACEFLVQNKFQDLTGLGYAIQKLAQRLGKWHITVSGTKFWNHPFRGNNAQPEAGKYDQRKSKLPNDDALLALAEIFANGYTSEQNDEDIYVSSQTCLLLSAPQRINEGRWFRTDLLREEKDKLGNNQLHIAYWVSKNGKYVRKPVPTSMANHTKEAIARLTKITEKGRKLAKYYESSPKKFYRHENCPDVLDTQVLSKDQVTQALGYKNNTTTQSFLKNVMGSFVLTGWTLDSLWNEIVLPRHRRLNPHFPYQIAPEDWDAGRPPRMSESLMCFSYRQLSNYQNTSPVFLIPFNSTIYTHRLAPIKIRKDKYKLQTKNIFAKHGYNGLILKSHQLRHFLNTLAEEAGVGIEEITKWSTRASQAQTRIYMHQDLTRKAIKISEKQITQSKHVLDPVTATEYNLIDKGPVITSRYGICTHDYTMTPCDKHADCLSCSELLMCKGHKRTLAAIQQEFDHLTENLVAAKSMIDAGKQVASRWYESHIRNHERISQLLQIMTDPSIEDGSPIQMMGKDFSHHKRIVDNKVKGILPADSDITAINLSEDILECLKLLNEESNV